MSDKEKIEGAMLVIASRVKELNKAAGFSTSADYLDTLSEEVHRLVIKGQRCAMANGRKTLKPQDL